MFVVGFTSFLWGCMWRSDHNMQESSFSNHVGTRDWTQVASHGGKCHPLLSPLTASKISFIDAVHVLLLVEISLVALTSWKIIFLEMTCSSGERLHAHRLLS